jgi:predicted TPR repeat methyltransferase
LQEQAHVSDEWFKAGSQEAEEVTDYYNNWARTYEDSVRSWDYDAPEIATQLLRKYSEVDGTVCDAGCGSGLTGVALKEGGFESIVGFDLTPDFADVAKEKKVYEDVHLLNMHERPFRYEDDEFANLICIGVLTYVENVPDVLREFARITKPNGMVIFSHRTDMVDDPGYQKKLKSIKEDKIWEEVYISDPQPYLPGNKDFSDKINIIYHAYRVA